MACPNKAFAAESTADLVARIQQHYDQIQSLRADFTQETRSSAASLGTSGSGKLYFLKPQALRWDYKEPKQKFVINEEQAWLYVPEEKTIYLYEVKRLLGSPLVLNFFSGLGRLGETFRITQLPAEPGPPMLYRLELLPREAEPSVSRVIFWVDATSYLVVQIQTEDPLGGVNQISLHNIEVGIPLDRSSFTLEIPAGVRVERQQVSPPN
jgi:outer membrane lipoprotein-sorting protein